MKNIVLRFSSIALFLCISISSAFAQYDTTWVKTYGGNRNDKAFDFIETNDNGYLVIGSTSSFDLDNSQMYFLKLDSAGNIMWSKSHGGAGQESGHSVIQTSDGSFVGVGSTNSWGAGGYDIFIVKLDINGNLIYEDTHGGYDWDFGWDIIEYSIGEYIIGGETQSFGAGESDGWVIRYNENSNSVVWNRTIGNINSDAINAVTKTYDGSISCTGYYTDTNQTTSDLLFLNISQDGQTINFQQTYGDTLNDAGNDILSFADSSVVFTGYTNIQDTSRTYTLKIDTQFNLLWEEKWTQGVYAEGKSVLERPDGNPGILSSIITPSSEYEFWFILMGYNGGGTLGSLGNDYASRMVLTHDDFYVMAGYTDGLGSSYSDILILKTDTGDYDTNNVYQITDTLNVVSIEKVEELNFSIYSTQFGIYISTEDYNQLPFSVNIYNTLGQHIHSSSMSNSSLSIPTTQFNEGIYYIIVNNNQNQYVLPVFITK